MARCLLALGSNLGNRQELLRRATRETTCLPDSRLLARSQWYETAPIGGPRDQGPFLNGALLLQTTLKPRNLLTRLQEIETRLGRERMVRWDARAIDIDLLLMDAQVIETPDLQIPHPRMSFRPFVLEPAVEIAGEMLHPTSGWTLAQLLFHLENAASYVAVAAAEPRLASWLADQLAQTLGCLRLEEHLSRRLVASDPEPQNAVEFCRWAEAALDPRCWHKDMELASRLPVAPGRLPPRAAASVVVSAFWLPLLFASQLRQEKKHMPPKGGGTVGAGSPVSWKVVQFVRPALVLALETDTPEKLLSAIGAEKSTYERGSPSMTPSEFRQILDQTSHGPMARIQAEDPAVILDEAIAAVRSVGPELRFLSTEFSEE